MLNYYVNIYQDENGRIKSDLNTNVELLLKAFAWVKHNSPARYNYLHTICHVGGRITVENFSAEIEKFLAREIAETTALEQYCTAQQQRIDLRPSLKEMHQKAIVIDFTQHKKGERHVY